MENLLIRTSLVSVMRKPPHLFKLNKEHSLSCQVIDEPTSQLSGEPLTSSTPRQRVLKLSRHPSLHSRVCHTTFAAETDRCATSGQRFRPHNYAFSCFLPVGHQDIPTPRFSESPGVRLSRCSHSIAQVHTFVTRRTHCIEKVCSLLLVLLKIQKPK